MTGYTRNDTANNIANGNIVDATDFDGEFDAIQAAFNSATGHNHDGSVGSGAPITIVGPTQEVVVNSAAIQPKASNLIDIGTSALKFKDAYLAGTATVGALVAATADINAGTIDGASVGASAASTGRFTTLVTTGAATLASVSTASATITGGSITGITDLAVADGGTGASDAATARTNLGLGSIATQNTSAVTLTGGTINGISVGATTPSTGAFTTLSASSGITGALTGNASTATKLATARSISLSGDVTGSVSFDGSANVTIAATISADAVALGTDTTGNYVATVAGTTNQIDVSGSGSETSAVTLSLPSTVVLPGTLQTTSHVIVGGNLTVNGTTTTVNSNTVNIGDNTIVLNADETGAPSQDAGIEIERGTSANVSWLWDEVNDRWSAGTQSIYAGGGFIGNLTGNVTGTASNATTAVTLTGMTATVTEINYLAGVTSAVQTQINSKQATITGAASSVVSSNLAVNSVAVTDASGKLAASATITTTELGYLDGVTSSVQTQLDNRVTNNADDSLTGGYTTTAVDDGTKTTGTYVPSPSGGNMKRIINGGTFAIGAPTVAGDYSIVVQITNAATGAGTISLTGFNKTLGSAFTTTANHDFFVFITKCNGFTFANVVALQ